MPQVGSNTITVGDHQKICSDCQFEHSYHTKNNLNFWICRGGTLWQLFH
uniref:Uncharacterized protein n=1 Tax=Arundo donax TaxID=35708 RepID=A0A0A9GF36_ARUDO